MKFITTEGKTAQEVQDYFDECVENGERAYEGVLNSIRRFDYIDEFNHSAFTYAGVDTEGDTLLSSDIQAFCEVDILKLLSIKDAAEKIAQQHTMSLAYNGIGTFETSDIEALKDLLS